MCSREGYYTFPGLHRLKDFLFKSFAFIQGFKLPLKLLDTDRTREEEDGFPFKQHFLE